MKKVVVLILMLLFFPVSSTAYEAQDNPSFRCGNLFVEEGVHSFQVRKHCGEPLFKEFYMSADYRDKFYIEKWIYGPEAGFYYILFFKVGVLVDFEAYRTIW